MRAQIKARTREIVLRRATQEDMAVVAQIHRLAFFGAMPHMPVLHSPEEDLDFFSDRVFPECEMWVAVQAGRPEEVAGFIAFDREWVHHLYVHPDAQRIGMGSALLHLAQASTNSLHLWAFQCNVNARRFYEKHGFQIERETDGIHNEEKQPDVLYQWTSEDG